MKKVPPAASPDAYVAALTGWQQVTVKKLRAAVLKAQPGEERIKWGHIVYFTGGPLGLIRAEETRVLFGFWRGKRLLDIEPKLKPGGKYEMATLEIREGDAINAARATRVMKAAIALNKTVGDPTKAAPAPKSKAKRKTAKTKP